MILDRARACLGVRFRVHGRDPATGLDCVGLAAFALEIGDAPGGYGLRGGLPDRVAKELRRRGLVPATGREPGDLLLCASGPGQLHFGIWSGTGLIHACAQARRVVERPGAPPWPILAGWRRGDEWRP